MSNIMPFIVMSSLEAARFRDLTQNDSSRLDPVLVRGGTHITKYALPARVKTDPDFQSHWDAFAMCDEVAIDIEVGFPPEDALRSNV